MLVVSWTNGYDPSQRWKGTIHSSWILTTRRVQILYKNAPKLLWIKDWNCSLFRMVGNVLEEKRVNRDTTFMGLQINAKVSREHLPHSIYTIHKYNWLLKNAGNSSNGLKIFVSIQNSSPTDLTLFTDVVLRKKLGYLNIIKLAFLWKY